MQEYKDVDELTREGYEHIFANDIHRYYLDGELHREEGPAVIYHFGMEKWYWHGKSHRVNGPAETMNDGMEFRERFFLDDKEVDANIYRKILYGKLEELPLYLNTAYGPVVKKRLESGLKLDSRFVY